VGEDPKPLTDVESGKESNDAGSEVKVRKRVVK
jgi:hypothetical protein